MRVHTNERRFVCSHTGCEKSFQIKGHLLRHNKIHTGLKPFMCDFEGCGKLFTLKQNLDDHRLIHTNRDKQFVCPFDECDKKYLHNYDLQEHINKHTKLRTFPCDQKNCDKVFLTRSSLYMHKKCHSDEFPFACEHCSYRANYRASIVIHMKGHERQKFYTYTCDLQDGGTQVWKEGDIKCSIRCKTRYDLEYHVERNHTTHGIAAKTRSEQRLAEFFLVKGVPFDRDWQNRIKFDKAVCSGFVGNTTSARPDFHLLAESVRLNATVLVGNDEHCHRTTPCDLQRTFNITQALIGSDSFENSKVVYFRLNPHSYQMGSTRYDHTLDFSHEKLWKCIQNLQQSDLKPNLNLIYVNYDRDVDGNLEIFNVKSDEDPECFATLLKDCVIQSI